MKGVVFSMSEMKDWSTGVKPYNSGNRADVGAGPVAHLERVTMNLTLRSVRALSNLVGWTGYTKTDAINRALQVFEFVRQVAENGGSVHVRQSQYAELERVTFF
jgi:hypothetical protein